MNPGLVVKLRPAGPWRIGPDSGARNRVDFIYHSDSLYSAVTSAMARLGSLDAWLDATARRAEGAMSPAVCFSSCFPFLDEIGFVVPPRTVWPPVSRALVSARVRWKSARFVPLGVVQAILAGQRLDENHWSVDGPSECLVPAGQPGPFRTGVRWSAAVDRLTGSSERHSTACIEFRPGAGLWTIVSFVDEAAQAQWLEPVKAAFRLLADTGFGGERSRGWGRAEPPEFIDGILPDMILPPPPPAQPAEHPVGQVTDLPSEGAAEQVPAPPAPVEEQPAATPISEPTSPAAEQPIAKSAPVGQVLDLPSQQTTPLVSEEPDSAAADPAAEPTTPTEPPEPVAPVAEPPSELPPVEEPTAEPIEPTEAKAAVRAPSELEPLALESSLLPPTEPEPPASDPAPSVVETAPSTSGPIPSLPAPAPPIENSEAANTESALPEPESPEPESSVLPNPESTLELPAQQPAPPAEPVAASGPEVAEPTLGLPQAEAATTPAPELAAPAPGPRPPAPETAHPHWLLSLFTPAPADAVDWRRGNYTVLARGGRVESPAGSGELKKQIQMVAEGSVVYAPTGPCGTAADVAPDGFAHPVFRAGFAVSIPLPEVS